MMKRVFWLGLVAVIAACWVGCESGEDLSDSDFRIDPTEVAINDVSGTAVFRVIGGKEPFTWSVSDSTLGSISPTNSSSARTATYTRTGVSGANTVQVRDSRTWVASALVVQANQLQVSPTEVTLVNDGDRVILNATGGQAPYSWDVSDPTKGSIARQGPTQAIYTRTGSGDVTVIITDNLGSVSLVTITQAAPLGVAPTDITLSEEQTTVLLTATGGVPPYVWAVVTPDLGTVAAQGTDQAIYTRLDGGTNTILLTDQSGTRASGTIRHPAKDTTVEPMVLNPESAVLWTDGDTALFMVSGGKPPYAWSVAVPSVGSVVGQGTNQATYTRANIGDNTIIVTDAADNLAAGSVYQPAP